jgi:uncharacterized membrane protein
VDEKTLEAIPGDREFIAIGVGDKPEKAPHLLIMEEPYWVYTGSGVFLILAGILKGYLAIDISSSNPLPDIVSIIVALILIVCGGLILRRIQGAGWVVFAVMFVNIVIAGVITDETADGIGWVLWHHVVATFQFFTCGMVGIIPPTMGLKKA